MIAVGIVGCGRIAGGYDEAVPGALPKTHAGAYRRHPAVRLLACVEPDATRRAAFARHWGVEHQFADIGALRRSGLLLDVVSICTPDARHAEDLAAMADLPVRAVFVEKPLARDPREVAALVARYAQADRALAVAYLRRWDPTLRTLATAIADGRYGPLRAAHAWYGKGLLHNGSHMIDLLSLLLGDLRPVAARVRHAGPDPEDPTIEAELEAQCGASVRLIATDHRDYDLFEATLFFSDGVVELKQGASVVIERRIEPTPGYAGHRRPGEGERWPPHQAEAMGLAVDNLIEWLENGAPIACDGKTALRTLDVCARIRELAR